MFTYNAKLQACNPVSMKITKATHHDWQVIYVEGQIDSKTSTELRDYLASELSLQMPVALELSKVLFMSSAGLRTLLLTHQKTRSAGIKLALIGLVDDIVETMKITGFLDQFTLLDSVDSLATN